MAMASSSKRSVLLDTNILIYSASRPFDIAYLLGRAGYIDIRVPEAVLDELRRLSDEPGRSGKGKGGGGKLRRFARLALEIAGKFQPVPTPTGVPADGELLRLARDEGYVVATSDAALMRHLRSAGAPVIFLKDGRLVADFD